MKIVQSDSLGIDKKELLDVTDSLKNRDSVPQHLNELLLQELKEQMK